MSKRDYTIRVPMVGYIDVNLTCASEKEAFARAREISGWIAPLTYWAANQGTITEHRITLNAAHGGAVVHAVDGVKAP